MMGRRDRDQRQLFYEFNLDEMIPKSHLLRRVDVFVTAVLSDERAAEGILQRANVRECQKRTRQVATV